MTRLLQKRILGRGHTAKDIYPIFLQAEEKININAITNFVKYKDTTKIKEIENMLVFYYKYHPRDISRKKKPRCLKKL